MRAVKHFAVVGVLVDDILSGCATEEGILFDPEQALTRERGRSAVGLPTQRRFQTRIPSREELSVRRTDSDTPARRARSWGRGPRDDPPMVSCGASAGFGTSILVLARITSPGTLLSASY